MPNFTLQFKSSDIDRHEADIRRCGGAIRQVDEDKVVVEAYHVGVFVKSFKGTASFYHVSDETRNELNDFDETDDGSNITESMGLDRQK